MSSELTIDIQLTELGFSSWDFQLLKQKETPPTHDAAPSLEATASPSPEDDEPSHSQTDPAPTEEKGPGRTSRKRSEYDHKRDSQNKGDGNAKLQEGHKGLRKTNENWEIEVDVNEEVEIDDHEEEDEEEEEDDDDEDLTEDEDNRVFSSDTNSSEEHRCQVCGLTFSTEFLLREHSHVHTGVRPYSCSECNKQFCHLLNYRAHLRSHATFSCLICMARFATQELLQGHLDTNHFENEFYQCDFCKRIFTSINECEEHVQTHQQEEKRYPCSQCDRSFHNQASLNRHLQWHQKSALICTDCGQAFSKKLTLLRHSFVHLGLLPYTCVHCKRHFRLASLYHKHKCKPESIQCVACLVVFKSQDDFDKHKKDTGCWGHQMASPLKTNDIRCMECGQIFDSSEDLKKHAGTHQRIMKCSECGMGFRSSLMLMSHMGGHAAVRPCLCKECGLGFPHQHAYDSHLKTCGMVTPAETAVKKTKSKTQKKESTIPPKSKFLQAVTPKPQNDVLQGVPLQSIASVGNQTKPSEGQWTLVLNKDHGPRNVPLVMFLPTSITPAAERSPNPQILGSTSEVSEKVLSVPHILDIPLASTSQVANSDKPVLLQGMASQVANVLIPLTTSVKGTKMQWTVLEDQITSGLSNENGRMATHAEVKQTINISQTNAENRQKVEVSSKAEAMNDSQKTNPNLLNLSTAGADSPETPLCLVKVKVEPDDQYGNQRGTMLEMGRSSSDNDEETSAALLSVKLEDDALDGVAIKKEPEEWKEHRCPKVSPHGSDGSGDDLKQCEICGIVPLENKMVHHKMEDSVDSASVSRPPDLSPPSSPPCKRLNLG